VDRYLERLVDPWIAEVLSSAPAVMITGARASGKTTTARRHAASVVRLDNEREGARGVIGVEIKAHSAPTRAHARHLVWLRDQLGERFRSGAVLHTGPARFRLDERIEAIPICALWG